ncbi:PPE domain-containing protein [Mycolicibacterium stellerae]|uniref:PPE domain-containing protein n=1 Tax=Mycolicibacterium stellerae TaxID=2358193 RepID=UPI000F0B7FB0|nr:PPE domain-containing protein [Mycolicibacterium stellerae]
MAGQWSALPPEVNAGQLMAGDQGASIAAAAAAYEALAAALTAEGAKMAATAGVTASTGWVGVGGTAMMATAMPYVAALELLAAWVQQSAASAAAIEQAYVTAKMGMIPVPACTTNRVTWDGLCKTNFFGINFPPMGALDVEYFGHFWTNNAGMMGGYEGIVSAILVTLGIPPPPAPLTANPAGAAGQAAAISQAAASGATSAAMSQSLSGVNQAASAVQPGAQTAAAPAQSMASMAPQMMSQLGQLPQMAAQPLQMLGQFPQMLGQMPQMAMGMLGPLSSGMGGGGIGTAGIDKVGQFDQTTLAATTDAAARGGGGGGAGGLGGGAGVMSSFTRPTGSFNAPGPPKLPTGWTPGAAVPEVAASAGPATGGGTGGLYGAPAAAGAAGHMGRDERGREGSAEGRTMQLTVGPRSGRED